MLTDDIKIGFSEYKGGHLDWDDDGRINHRKTTLLEGAGVKKLVEKSGNELHIKNLKPIQEEFNNQGYDYKLFGQNSNSAAKLLVDGLGLKFKLPEYYAGSQVWAPEWNTQFEHTLVDYLTEFKFDKASEKLQETLSKKLQEFSSKLDEAMEKARNVIKILNDTIGDEKAELSNQLIKLKDVLKDNLSKLTATFEEQTEAEYERLCKAYEQSEKAKLDATCSVETATRTWRTELFDEVTIHYECEKLINCNDAKYEIFEKVLEKIGNGFGSNKELMTEDYENKKSEILKNIMAKDEILKGAKQLILDESESIVGNLFAGLINDFAMNQHHYDYAEL